MTEMQKKIIEVFEKFVIDLKSVAENPAYAALCDKDRDTLFGMKLVELMARVSGEIKTILGGK